MHLACSLFTLTLCPCLLCKDPYACMFKFRMFKSEKMFVTVCSLNNMNTSTVIVSISYFILFRLIWAATIGPCESQESPCKKGEVGTILSVAILSRQCFTTTGPLELQDAAVEVIWDGEGSFYFRRNGLTYKKKYFFFLWNCIFLKPSFWFIFSIYYCNIYRKFDKFGSIFPVDSCSCHSRCEKSRVRGWHGPGVYLSWTWNRSQGLVEVGIYLGHQQSWNSPDIPPWTQNIFFLFRFWKLFKKSSQNDSFCWFADDFFFNTPRSVLARTLLVISRLIKLWLFVKQGPKNQTRTSIHHKSLLQKKTYITTNGSCKITYFRVAERRFWKAYWLVLAAEEVILILAPIFCVSFCWTRFLSCLFFCVFVCRTYKQIIISWLCFCVIFFCVFNINESFFVHWLLLAIVGHMTCIFLVERNIWTSSMSFLSAGSSVDGSHGALQCLRPEPRLGLVAKKWFGCSIYSSTYMFFFGRF